MPVRKKTKKARLVPETPRVSLGHIPELDGVRGFAALAVFVLHIFITVRDAPNQKIPAVVRPVLQFVDLGSYGVDIFFVLSGFLITCLLLLDRDRPRYYRNFYWKRVLRIQPVYILHLIGTWLLLPGSHGYVFLALIFLVNFAGPFHVQVSGPAWTLSIEEQFYLLWPQIVRRAKVDSIYRITLAMIALSVGLRLIATFVFGHMAYQYTFYRLDGLALGALLALQWIGARPVWPQILPVLKILNGPAILWAAIAYAVWTAVLPGRSTYAISLLVVNVLVYRVISFILLNPRAGSTSWLRSAPMVFLGAISYSLYMFHSIVIYVYDSRIAAPTFQPGPFVLRAFVVSVVTLVLCLASRKFVETPVQKMRRFVLR